MDEAARQAELTRARQEAAKFRTELRAYEKAFGHLAPDARDWLLETIGMMDTQASPEQRAQAAGRLGELTVNWMGEDFVPWAQSISGATLETESFALEGNDMDQQQFEAALEAMEERLSAKFEGRFAQYETNQQKAATDARKQEIISRAIGLGYNLEDWRGKMYLQALAETKGDYDAAHALMQERGIAPPVEETENQTPPGLDPTPAPSATEAPQPADRTPVPPTGGLQSGGLGVPETPGEEITTWGEASDAALELLSGAIQPGE
jgi:hypothetical protein